MKQQMKKTRIWKKVAFLLIVELLFFYLVQLIVPSCNVLVEKLDGHYVGYVNDRTGYQTIRFSDEGKGTVQSTLYHIDKEVELDIAKEKAKSDVPVTVLNLERLHPYTYQGMYDIVIYNALLKQSAVFVLFNLALIVMALLAKKERFSLADFAACFFYRSKRQEPWRRKQWLILLAVLLLSFIIAPGVDLPSITRMSSNFISGGDIYQIQNLREMEVYSLEFNSYPYNPIMLLFYSLPDILSFGFAPFYLQTYVLLLPAAIFKLCNALLMREVILSLEGYMLDCGLLSNNQKRSSYWFVFCTPVIFYVAISYIQLDVLPMYFITEGLLQLLRFDEKRVNRAVGAVLMAMGCLCKLQNLLLAPACFLVFFVLIWHKRQEVFNAIVYLCTLLFCMANIYIWNPIIGTFLSQNQQSKRIWFTAFPYVVDAAFLYLTIFFVVLFFALASLQFRSTLRKEQLLFGALLINSSLVLLFSATILDTLSTYIISFPAFVYTLYRERDDMKRFMIWAFSVLILTQWMFGNVGDVTSALHYLGRTGIFSKIEQELAGTPEGIQLSSTLFTLTKAGLTLYVIIFYGELRRLCNAFSKNHTGNGD